MPSENANRSAPTFLSGAVQRSELPRLDLLRSFEAAARTLSFTQAAQELFLTQSAVSRQIQQIEAGLGVALFERKHRALALTEGGNVLYRAVVDCLERLRDATALVRATSLPRQVALTCTPGFASLWLIPRLSRFTTMHPEVDVRVSATLEVQDLDRNQLDLAVRLSKGSKEPGPPLFAEFVQPVCAPQLVKGGPYPLRRPADLQHHTMLTMETPHGVAPMVDWEPWIRLMGLGEVRMKNTMQFTLYTDAVGAAVAGQGVAIGRFPLLAELLKSGRLVAPFGGAAASQHGYFVVLGARAAANPDAQAFLEWMRAEAAFTASGI